MLQTTNSDRSPTGFGGFRIEFRSRLTAEHLRLLEAELGLVPRGEFWNYFNSFKGGEVGARQGGIPLRFSASQVVPDVYTIEAFPGSEVSSSAVQALKSRVHSVVERIADLAEAPANTAIHFFVRHRGRPAGELYRLRIGDGLVFERWTSSGYIVATSDAWWVLAGRFETEVSEADAARVAGELEKQAKADAADVLYEPALGFVDGPQPQMTRTMTASMTSQVQSNGLC